MDLFKELRESYPEYLKPPPYPIMLEVDKKDAFDYAKACCVGMSIHDLKQELAKEVEFIREK